MAGAETGLHRIEHSRIIDMPLESCEKQPLNFKLSWILTDVYRYKFFVCFIYIYIIFLIVSPMRLTWV